MNKEKDLANRKVIVMSKNGIHMRPGLMLVELASRYVSNITLDAPSGVGDAKSIMHVTMLCILNGDEVTIIAEGEDAQEAVEAIAELIESDFSKELIEDMG